MTLSFSVPYGCTMYSTSQYSTVPENLMFRLYSLSAYCRHTVLGACCTRSNPHLVCVLRVLRVLFSASTSILPLVPLSARCRPSLVCTLCTVRLRPSAITRPRPHPRSLRPRTVACATTSTSSRVALASACMRRIRWRCLLTWWGCSQRMRALLTA